MKVGSRAIHPCLFLRVMHGFGMGHAHGCSGKIVGVDDKLGRRAARHYVVETELPVVVGRHRAGQCAGKSFDFFSEPLGPIYQPRDLSSSPTRGQLIWVIRTSAPFTGSPLGVKTLPSIG